MLLCLFFLMIRRPPKSTRTDTLFPYTTLFRSVGADAAHRSGDRRRDQIAPARTPSAPAGHALEAADADLGRHTRNRLSLEQQVKARRSQGAFLVDHRRGRAHRAHVPACASDRRDAIGRASWWERVREER